MNVYAGILIGVVNNTWLARIITPFIWGIVFCIYTSITRKQKEEIFIENAKNSGRKAMLGMSHYWAFYFIEYMTATFIALAFSIISGFIKKMFF